MILPLLFSAILALIFTLSRSGIVALVGGMLVVFSALYRSSLNKNKIIRYSFFLMLFIVFVLFFQSTEGFEERVMQSDTISYKMSYHARIRDFFRPFNDAFENPLIFLVGRGPSKAVLRTSAHSDWGWMFHRFGLPGLMFYVLLISNGLIAGVKLVDKATSGVSQIFIITALFNIVVWAFYANAEDIFKDAQVMAINMFSLGILGNRYLFLLKTPQQLPVKSSKYSSDGALPQFSPYRN